ncbi:MAG: hypothetical protein JXL81_09405 [Deltaproteobacteria bacterium]|nr:hypothetical protein [Deltaproteobacteria bacterium]
MTTIEPKGEKIRQTVKWISDKRKSDDSLKNNFLVQEASMRFNLSPKDEEFLIAFYNNSG